MDIRKNNIGDVTPSSCLLGQQVIVHISIKLLTGGQINK